MFKVLEPFTRFSWAESAMITEAAATDGDQWKYEESSNSKGKLDAPVDAFSNHVR